MLRVQTAYNMCLGCRAQASFQAASGLQSQTYTDMRHKVVLCRAAFTSRPPSYCSWPDLSASLVHAFQVSILITRSLSARTSVPTWPIQSIPDAELLSSYSQLIKTGALQRDALQELCVQRLAKLCGQLGVYTQLVEEHNMSLADYQVRIAAGLPNARW